MGRVALVYPYLRTRSATELLFPPLGSALLSAELSALGIESRVFDCTFDSLQAIQQKIFDFAPQVIGVYSMVTLSRKAFHMAEILRAALPNSLLVAGGPLPTLYPDQYLPKFDIVFRGEADASFPNFCRDLFDSGVAHHDFHKIPLTRYPGLFARSFGSTLDNPAVHHSQEQIDRFPLPDRSAFDHNAYKKAWIDLDGTKTTSIIITLGCPFDCDFCSRPIFGSLFRRRDLDMVMQEIAQIRELGYDSLWIADDNFTLDLKYLKEFCLRMTGKQISWSCLSRVSNIDEDTVRLMKEAGCRRVYLGLESGNQATLNLMKKQIRLDEAEGAVQLFRKAGIEVAAFFIVGYPGESMSAIEDTFRFALSLPLNEISFNVPFPLPGSNLFERVRGLDGTKDWREENEVTFVFESEFDQGWLQRRVGETMQAFADRNGRLHGPRK